MLNELCYNEPCYNEPCYKEVEVIKNLKSMLNERRHEKNCFLHNAKTKAQ